MRKGVASYSWRLYRQTVAIVLASIVLIPSLTMAGTLTVSYTYDALGRLVQANYDNGARIVYGYDALGNRVAMQQEVSSFALTPSGSCWSVLLRNQ